MIDPKRYQTKAPTEAQRLCPHRDRNRDRTQCSTCGSVKIGSRWRYLKAAWFNYYSTGHNPPG